MGFKKTEEAEALKDKRDPEGWFSRYNPIK